MVVRVAETGAPGAEGGGKLPTSPAVPEKVAETGLKNFMSTITN
jgi:hypothetical protein